MKTIKKIITLSIIGVFALLAFYTTSPQANASHESLEFCNGPVGPVAFKMLNGGVYQDTTSAVRFVSNASCGIITYHWKFEASGVTMSSTTNVLRNITVADTEVPVGTSNVLHWTTHDLGNGIWLSPTITQSMTRLN